MIKADVGIRDGKIVGIGKSGNPGVMDGVTQGMVVGVSTDAISGEHLILTAAGIDTHIHLISRNRPIMRCPMVSQHSLVGGLVQRMALTGQP